MKRLLVAVVAVIFFGGVGLALFWFGSYFISYAFSTNGLHLETPSQRLLSLGTSTVFDLHGSGFDRNTTISLFVDVNNSEAIIGSYPLDGTYNASLLSGDFIYLAADGGGVQVLDIKEPQQPQLLKEYLVGRTIIDIHRNGNYLYLSCGQLGVSIMQILPNGLLDHTADISFESLAMGSQFVDGFLYVAAGSAGLLVYDVRQPEQVELVQLINAGSNVSKVTLAGEFLYVAAERKQIKIYQLNMPQMPLLSGSLSFDERLNDFAIQHEQLYVATESGVSSYRLANASQPEMLHHCTDFGSAKKIFAGLGKVYVSDSFFGLRIIDHAIGSSPGYVNLNINPRTLIETPDYLFVAGSNKGLLIVDRKSLSSRQAVKTIRTPGRARDLFIKDNWMYVADARGGVSLRALDGEEPSITTITSRWGESFTTHNELLFVAEAKKGIEVFDISVPSQPEPVAAWPNLQAMRIAVADQYLLLSKGISGVELVDIADLQHPVVRAVLPDVHALDVALDGHLVYIASKNKGLLIYEIVNDAKLNYLSQLQTPFPMNQFDLAISVQVKDKTAYVANGRSGMLIVDVANPVAPIILSSLEIPGVCREIRVVDHKAFITSHHGGITVVDIENPEKPILLNNISMPGLSRGLQIVGDFIYVTQREMGVAVVPIPVVAETVEFISKQQMQVTLPSPNLPGRYSLQVANHRGSVVVDGVVQYR